MSSFFDLLRSKWPLNGKTNKVVIIILLFLLIVCCVRIWVYHKEVTSLKNAFIDSIHSRAQDSMKYIYNCFLNSSEKIAALIPEESRVRYAVVIDAGSSGSRVYIYYWFVANEKSSIELVHISPLSDINSNPVVKKISPGLSSYVHNPENAYYENIKPLIDFALRHIQSSHVSSTQLFILATAGLRLLPQTYQQLVLNTLRNKILAESQFECYPHNIRVISGKEEGLYSWIAANAILDKLDSVKLSSWQYIHTVGTVDMGGGSIQIAFEVPQAINIPERFVYKLNFGLNSKHHVYVATYLGFGANEILKLHLKTLAKASLGMVNSNNINSNKSNLHVSDPCSNFGYSERREYFGKNFTFRGTGDFPACKRNLIHFLNTSSNCLDAYKCTMNGNYQPNIFSNMSFYGFSEFWYTMQDVLGIGGVYLKDKFELEVSEFCKVNWDTVLSWDRLGLYPNADMQRLITECFKAAWMSVVLHKGFHFPDNYNNLKSVELIQSQEIQWTMGALLYNLKHHSTHNDIPTSYNNPVDSSHIVAYLPPILLLLFAIILIFTLWYCFAGNKRLAFNVPRRVNSAKRSPGHSRASSLSMLTSSNSNNLITPNGATTFKKNRSSNSLRSLSFMIGDSTSSRRNEDFHINIEKVE